MPHIYAAGDCAGPVEIVHVAIQQGELAARHAAGVGGLSRSTTACSSSVVFTDPAVATIGMSEMAPYGRLERHTLCVLPF